MKLLISSLVILSAIWFGSRILIWQQAQQQHPTAIVVLGGGQRREQEAAHLAHGYPALPILISSGSALPCLYRELTLKQGIAWSRVKVDFRAKDTLGNFTALLPYLLTDQPRKVLLVTSAGQWPRAAVLSTLIWGSRGIAVEAVPIAGAGHEESWFKLGRDTVRALVWLGLGDITIQYRSDTEVNLQQKLPQARCESGTATLPHAFFNP